MSPVCKWGAVWALLALPGCDFIFPPDGGTGLGPDAPVSSNGIDAGPANDDAVAAHNEVRAAAKPVPSPALPPMHWDNSAALVAANWAANCMFAHSHTPG